MEIHRLQLQTCIFNEPKLFFEFVEANLKGSVAVTALIFHHPKKLIPKVLNRFVLMIKIAFFLKEKFKFELECSFSSYQKKSSDNKVITAERLTYFQSHPQIHELNLAHRLSLYIFFWNAKCLPSVHWNLREPLWAVMITNPRPFVYRIYYNQKTSSNVGKMGLVNWFDGNNLGLNREPILSHVKNIYKDFNGRIFIVPVVHVKAPATVNQSVNQSIKAVQWIPISFQSPPWIFISNNNNTLIDPTPMAFSNDSDVAPSFNVAGRDDSLLRILARKMNFQFKYIDVQSMFTLDNATQPGELGLQMLERRVQMRFMLLMMMISHLSSFLIRRKPTFCSAILSWLTSGCRKLSFPFSLCPIPAHSWRTLRVASARPSH